MGEHKRKGRDEDIRKLVDATTRMFTEQGRLIEAGYRAMVVLLYPDGSPGPAHPEQLREAFFAGAQHLFGSLTASVLDEDREPTEADLRRMDLIDSELKVFLAGFAIRHGFELPEAAKPGRRQ
jgi:hypothetical protein